MLFLAGFCVGVVLGFLVAALCNVAAKREDTCAEYRSVPLQGKVKDVA